MRRTGRLDTFDLVKSSYVNVASGQPEPTREELDNCRPYLEAELRMLGRIEVVLALGRIAHESWLRASGWWGRLAPRDRPSFAHGAEAQLPDGTRLLSSYHPSRQNTQTGRLTRVMWDAVFARARDLAGAKVAGAKGGSRGAR